MTFKLFPVSLYSIEEMTHPSNNKKQENTPITKIHKHKAIKGDEK